MTNAEIKLKLWDYTKWAQLWHCMNAFYPNEDQNDVLLKQQDIELEILTLYGLPHTSYFSEFFQFLGLLEEINTKDIDDFLENLTIEAEKYHSEPVLSDLKLLELAQIHQLDIEEVLPELTLRLMPEPYYTYLYFAHLLKGTASPLDILKELKTIKMYDLSIKLCKVSQDKSLLNTPLYQDLLGFDLKFLEDFLSDFDQTFDLLDFVKKYQPI